MGWIILGVIGFIVTSIISINLEQKNKPKLAYAIGNSAMIFIVLGIIMAVLLQSNTEKISIEKIDLLGITYEANSEEREKIFFVIVELDGTYKYCIKSENYLGLESEKEYEICTLTGENISIEEDSKCQKPQLLVYKRVSQNVFWHLTPIEKEYVFYIPLGTAMKYQIR